jgi:hypothetical protein
MGRQALRRVKPKNHWLLHRFQPKPFQRRTFVSPQVSTDQMQVQEEQTIKRSIWRWTFVSPQVSTDQMQVQEKQTIKPHRP